MSNNQSLFLVKTKDKVYIEFWKAEQEYVRTRWTIATFFLSISFAVFGFSFQNKLALPEVFALRTSSLFIYWFAYVLYGHFYAYSKFLRNYLLEMEELKHTSIDIQSKTEIALRPVGAKRFQTQKLLFLFGMIYTLGVILLLILGL